MSKLVRFVVGAVVLAVLVWFAVLVPIGKRTLWQHIVRIVKTEEAQDLIDGAKQTAQETAKQAIADWRKGGTPADDKEKSKDTQPVDGTEKNSGRGTKPAGSK